MNILKIIRNYYFYCGIEKDEFDAVKKDAYASNFRVWRPLHYLMAATFGFLLLSSLFNDLIRTNALFYLTALLYSVVAIILFFLLKQDSPAAQLVIYLSITMLFLFSCLITRNQPQMTAVTFVVMLVVTPMFMIDRPIFMTLELCVASAVFLVWMYDVKPSSVWEMDRINVVTFTFLGMFMSIIANSVRIKEFVLTRKINIQKDTDEMTGLKNKSALTREIDAFLADASSNKALLFIMDVDRFKAINDTYGHDVGDRVITEIGGFLRDRFGDNAVAGRFGGDEFIVFVKGTDDMDAACAIAEDIVAGVSEQAVLPDGEQGVSVSVGVAAYHGVEGNYSEIFKRADWALYQAKADPEQRFCVYG